MKLRLPGDREAHCEDDFARNDQEVSWPRSAVYVFTEIEDHAAVDTACLEFRKHAVDPSSFAL